MLKSLARSLCVAVCKFYTVPSLCALCVHGGLYVVFTTSRPPVMKMMERRETGVTLDTFSLWREDSAPESQEEPDLVPGRDEPHISHVCASFRTWITVVKPTPGVNVYR